MKIARCKYAANDVITNYAIYGCRWVCECIHCNKASWYSYSCEPTTSTHSNGNR